MKLYRVLSAAFVAVLLVGCADVGPHNTRWVGYPVFGTPAGLNENDTIAVGLRDDGVVVWKASTNKVANVLHVK